MVCSLYCLLSWKILSIVSVSQNGSEQFNIVKALEVEGQNTKSDV